MKPDKFQEQVFFATVRITIPGKTGSGASIGTGFLYVAPINDPLKRSAVLLISNRHVYGDSSCPIILSFHKKSTDGAEPDLGQVVTLQDSQFKDIYKGHPDSAIDLACINVSAITLPEHNVFYKSLKPDMIADFSEKDLLPGKDVWFVGYPENRFDTSHNLPILRRGYIASIPKIDFNNKRQFIIDAQVFPGSSGSPVFAVLGGKFKLLGVVAETMVRNEQLQAVPTEVTLGVQQILGLGIVIKATALKALIDCVTEEIKVALEKAENR